MLLLTMKNKTIIRNQNGGAAVEFAIILPLFIFLLFGIIEGGLLLYNQHIITNASREGARAGIIAAVPKVTDQEIRDKVKDYARRFLVTFSSDTLEDENINILPAYSTRNNAGAFGTDLVVDVTYNYDFLSLFNPITFKKFDGVPLEARTVMKME